MRHRFQDPARDGWSFGPFFISTLDLHRMQGTLWELKMWWRRHFGIWRQW